MRFDRTNERRVHLYDELKQIKGVDPDDVRTLGITHQCKMRNIHVQNICEIDE